MTLVLHHGDCFEVLPTLAENSIDACVTDPPYGLQFMGKEWDNLWRNRTGADQAYVERTTGTLASRARKLPDYKAANPLRMQEWHEEWARAVYPVLKPGGYLLAFGGTRTHHRLMCAIEDAGFEIRDCLNRLYGSGFPKSHTQPDGRGTALKPAWEPIIMARKPLIGTVASNVLQFGTGSLNIDGCRVDAAPGDKGDWPITKRRHEDKTYTLQPVPTDQSKGRWPANVVHDGSDEVLAMFPTTKSGTFSGHRNKPKTKNTFGEFALRDERGHVGDTRSAARFFYCAKASKKDRAGSKHPTVKPVALMRWLVRMVTPPGGTVLDPFAGSGTTLQAIVEEGFHGVGIEREAEYVADIERRCGITAELTEEQRLLA